MNKKSICPECGKEVEADHFACHFASKGGTAGVGEVKSRGSEHGKKAAAVRWAKYRESKKVEVPENFGNFEPKIEPKDG